MKRLLYAFLVCMSLCSVASLLAPAEEKKVEWEEVLNEDDSENDDVVEIDSEYISGINGVHRFVQHVDLSLQSGLLQKPSAMSVKDFEALQAAVNPAIDAVSVTKNYIFEENGRGWVPRNEIQDVHQSLSGTLKAYHGLVWLIDQYAKAAYDSAVVSLNASDVEQQKLGSALCKSVLKLKSTVMDLSRWNEIALRLRASASEEDEASAEDVLVPEWNE